MSRAQWRVVMLVLAAVLGGCRAATPVDRGMQLYGNLCQSCHQKNGSGARGLYPPLAGSPVPLGDADTMVAWVMYGDRPTALPRGQYAGVMPQFNFLSNADAVAVINHVRQNFGNAAPPVDEATVARVRAAHTPR